jgi:hypothetical protein
MKSGRFKFRYINAIRGAMIGFVIFLLASWFLPEVETSVEGLELILTISTFLFAIIAGFFISRLNSRFDSIRSVIGEGDGEMLVLFKLSEMISKRFSNRIREVIDNFYVAAYDFELARYDLIYKATAKYYFQFWDEIKKLKASERKEPFYTKFVDMLISSERRRNVTSALASERLAFGQWAVLIILAFIIVFCIFYLKTAEFYSSFLAVLLSTVVVLVILLIRDLQNLIIGKYELLEESGQEVLEFIGKKRYYHIDYLMSGFNSVPKSVKEYRVGLHEPGSETHKIKIVKNK